MPRPQPRDLPGLDQLFDELRDADVTNIPDSEPGGERTLASVLAFTLYFTDRQKRVEFPKDMSLGEPQWRVVDSKLTVPVRWAELEGLADLQAVIDDAGLHAAMDGKPFLLALDALDAEGAEFQYQHALYGEPVMLAFRVQAPGSREHRIEAARADGWTPTLKEHNLIPGRSLFVPDDAVGLFLTEPTAEHLLGLILLLPDGNFTLCLNPFAKKADPDLQYWLSWGQGEAGSEWKQVLSVGEQPDFGYHGALHESGAGSGEEEP